MTRLQSSLSRLVLGTLKPYKITLDIKIHILKWNREGIWEERPARVSWINFIRALKNIKPQARWTQDKAKCLDKLSLLSWPTAQKVLTFFFLTISQSLPTTFQNKKKQLTSQEDSIHKGIVGNQMRTFCVQTFLF